MSNPNFIILSLSYALSFSIQSTLAAVVGPLTQEFGYKSDDVSVFGGAFIVCGLIGSFAHAIILDRYKRFKFQYLFIIFGAIPTFGLIVLGL